MTTLHDMQRELSVALDEFAEQVKLSKGQLFVVGCSTSEVLGAKIGTAGAMDVAQVFYEELVSFAKKYDINLAFQGCEHINRALTMERQAAERYGFECVSVVPVRTAGGSMAAYAYTQLEEPVVVEHIVAHAGIDIGQTLIGMHMKHVAIPVRTSIKQIGDAIITFASTRPKLIGGPRAQYE